MLRLEIRSQITLAISFCVCFCTQISTAAVPDNIANQPIPLISGEIVRLGDYKNKKAVYLKFWASWCQPCRKEMPHFVKSHDQFEENIQVISINVGINETQAEIEESIETFGLSMPNAIDSNGQLAKTFGFIGTPYHLIFDKHLNLVHRGHNAGEQIDNKLALLASNKNIEEITPTVLKTEKPNLNLNINLQKNSIVMFTATWCDWYLKETKPAAAQACHEAQTYFSILAKNNPSTNFVVVASGLWTGEKDLKEFEKKYRLDGLPNVSTYIDQSNSTFIAYGVRQYPKIFGVNKIYQKDISNEVSKGASLSEIFEE